MYVYLFVYIFLFSEFDLIIVHNLKKFNLKEL
jgi:hypothetical protein